MKKLLFIYVLFLLLLAGYGLYYFKYLNNKSVVVEEPVEEIVEEPVIEEEDSKPFDFDPYNYFGDTVSYLNDDFMINDLDGSGYNYYFDYNGETFYCMYETDNWRIIDSYKIHDEHDMRIICQSLINIYPIPSKDYSSYRSADDMVKEWQIHNFVYEMLPENNSWRLSAKDVDFDPKDQGKTYEEFFEEKTGVDYNKIFSGNN